MKITFLGTSHGAPEPGHFCTSVLIEHNGCHYLIDLGAPVEALLVNRHFDFNTLKGVFITHMHADHTDALFSICKGFGVYHKEASADFFFPEEGVPDAVRAWHKTLHGSIPEDRFRMHITHEGVIFNENGLKVSAIRTEHISPDVPSYAYLFETDTGKRVLFTGDLAYDYHDYPAVTRESDFDLVVSELTHCRADKAYDLLDAVRTKLMIFSHITPYSVRFVEENNISFHYPHVFAVDGFEYYVV